MQVPDLESTPPQPRDEHGTRRIHEGRAETRLVPSIHAICYTK